MKKTVMTIARTAKTYDEFIDNIYALDAYVFIDDDNDGLVYYVADNGRTYTYDVSQYTSKMN